MNCMVAKWEDEENNRHVHYAVNYTVESDGVNVIGITPKQVDFIDQNRSIGVHTTAGRNLLAEKIIAAGDVETQKQAIAEKEGLLSNA